MAKEKILYIGGFELPDRNAAAQRVISVSKILCDLNYEVFLMGLSKTADSFVFSGFKCTNLKYPNGLFRWMRYLVSIKDYKNAIETIRPSIVIAYNHPSWALNNLMKFCHKRGIKVMADCTEWYTPAGNLLFRIIKGRDTYNRMTKVQPKLDGVISISRYLYDFYNDKGTKTIMVPPLVDCMDLKWKNQNIENSTGAIKLVYAGSPGNKDRLDLIIKAISQYNEKIVSLKIVGLNELQFRDLYRYSEIIPSFIEFKGRVSHEEVLSLLMTCDFQIFVRDDNITTKAGFPTKFVESISAGIPVLTNLTSNLSDYLSNGKNGCVLDASSEDSLIISIQKVLQLPKNEIDEIKRSVNKTTFDYRHYVPQMKMFIDSI